MYYWAVTSVMSKFYDFAYTVTTSFPLTEVFQVERTDSKTGETVYELYKSVEDANTRISEIGENNITVKRLAVIMEAHDSHT